MKYDIVIRIVIDSIEIIIISSSFMPLTNLHSGIISMYVDATANITRRYDHMYPLIGMLLISFFIIIKSKEIINIFNAIFEIYAKDGEQLNLKQM